MVVNDGQVFLKILMPSCGQLIPAFSMDEGLLASIHTSYINCVMCTDILVLGYVKPNELSSLGNRDAATRYFRKW